MASVSIAGCLLTQNKYYLKSSISSGNSFSGSDPVNLTEIEKTHQGLPEATESNWWIKYFFHSDPVPPDIESKELFAYSNDIPDDIIHGSEAVTYLKPQLGEMTTLEDTMVLHIILFCAEAISVHVSNIKNSDPT